MQKLVINIDGNTKNIVKTAAVTTVTVLLVADVYKDVRRTLATISNRMNKKIEEEAQS